MYVVKCDIRKGQNKKRRSTNAHEKEYKYAQIQNTIKKTHTKTKHTPAHTPVYTHKYAHRSTHTTQVCTQEDTPKTQSDTCAYKQTHTHNYTLMTS